MHRNRAPFWIRSIRRRPAAVVVLTVLAALATVVSVLAPMLLRAVQQTALDEALDHAGVPGTSIAASADYDVAQEQPAAEEALFVTMSEVRHGRLWSPVVTVAEAAAPVTFPDPTAPDRTSTAGLAGSVEDCAAFGLTAGRCPQGEHEVLAPAGRDIPVGTTLRARVVDVVAERRLVLRVVGTYDEDGAGRVVASPGRLFGGGSAPGDDLLMSGAGLAAVDLEGTQWSVRTLRHGTTLDDLPAVRADVAHVRAGTLTEAGADSDVSVVEHIDSLAADVADGNGAAAVIVGVTALQGVVVAWFAQGVVVARIGRARAAEWGLARLRGLSRRRRFGTVLAELLTAVLVGSAIGIGVGIAVAALVTRLVLVDGSPEGVATVGVDPLRAPVLLATGAAVLGSVTALVLASGRSARVPLVDLLRHATEPRTLSRAGAVVQAVAVVGSLAVLAAVVAQQRISGNGVALLAPTLVAVLFAVVGLRIGVAVVRCRSRRTPKSLGQLLVVRRMARTPSMLTTAVMVTMGVALAVSSCQTAVLAVRLQADSAAARLGAATALDVRVAPGVSFLDAVRRADPGGQQAMAVMTTPRGSGVGRLVAVDVSRLLSVSSWRPAWAGRDARPLLRALRPAVGGSLELTGTRLTVGLADIGAIPGNGPDHLDPPAPGGATVVATVQTHDGAWHRVDLGRAADGDLSSEPGTFPCADGCRLVSLGLEATFDAGTPYGLAATITGISTRDGSTTHRVSSGWSDPDRWRDRIGESPLSQGGASGLPVDGRTGLRVLWSDPTGAGRPAIAPRDAPEPLPAAIGTDTATEPFPGVEDATVGVGLSGDTLLIEDAGRAAALPRVLGDGALVDLQTAVLVSDPTSSAVDHEVWLAPGRHPTVRASLRAHGITVTRTRTLAEAEARAERAAPALGAVVGTAVAAAALALTLLAVTAVAVVGAAARREDVAVLRTIGFTRKRTFRAMAMETAGPTVAAAVLGGIAGTVATVLTAGRLPLRASALPPIGVPVGPWTVVVVVAVAVIGLVVIALVAAAGTTRPGRGPAREETRT
jgi:hypothetical protein